MVILKVDPFCHRLEIDRSKGIKSTVRRKLAKGVEAPTISTGLAVFRATLEMAELAEDPALSHLVLEPGLNLW